MIIISRKNKLPSSALGPLFGPGYGGCNRQRIKRHIYNNNNNTNSNTNNNNTNSNTTNNNTNNYNTNKDLYTG